MPEDQKPDRVSIEAHERVTRERDELKASVDQLQRQVRGLGVQSHAQSWLVSRGVTDSAQQQAWMNTMGPHFDAMEFESTEQLPDMFEQRFGSLIPPPQPASPETAPSEPTQTAPTSTPGFATPQPGSGTPIPDRQPIVAYGDEWYKIKAEQGEGALRALHNEGLIRYTGTDGSFPVEQR